MIVKMTNKDEKFYQYMGRIFGSRVIEKQTNDRIYDDNDKEWYIALEENKVKAFVSISQNKIKNVYAIEDRYLEEILEKVKLENQITYSIVTKSYEELYEKCGFKIYKDEIYKNFLTIYIEEKMSKSSTKLSIRKEKEESVNINRKKETKTNKKKVTKTNSEGNKRGKDKNE
ncbi:MAG: hypothetical protein HFJ48_07875 [Clostridia bacterium]|nr:hypothetical protein [Clostridia bacterium]